EEIDEDEAAGGGAEDGPRRVPCRDLAQGTADVPAAARADPGGERKGDPHEQRGREQGGEPRHETGGEPGLELVRQDAQKEDLPPDRARRQVPQRVRHDEGGGPYEDLDGAEGSQRARSRRTGILTQSQTLLEEAVGRAPRSDAAEEGHQQKRE